MWICSGDPQVFSAPKAKDQAEEVQLVVGTVEFRNKIYPSQAHEAADGWWKTGLSHSWDPPSTEAEPARGDSVTSKSLDSCV